jgi:hypothetical protein
MISAETTTPSRTDAVLLPSAASSEQPCTAYIYLIATSLILVFS